MPALSAGTGVVDGTLFHEWAHRRGVSHVTGHTIEPTFHVYLLSPPKKWKDSEKFCLGFHNAFCNGGNQVNETVFYCSLLEALKRRKYKNLRVCHLRRQDSSSYIVLKKITFTSSHNMQQWVAFVEWERDGMAWCLLRTVALQLGSMGLESWLCHLPALTMLLCLQIWSLNSRVQEGKHPLFDRVLWVLLGWRRSNMGCLDSAAQWWHLYHQPHWSPFLFPFLGCRHTSGFCVKFRQGPGPRACLCFADPVLINLDMKIKERLGKEEAETCLNHSGFTSVACPGEASQMTCKAPLRWNPS